MAAPRTGPCEWGLLYPCASTNPSGCTHLDALPSGSRVAIETMAVEYLWNWSDQKYGVCEDTIRPCRRDCTEGLSTYNGRSHYDRSPWGVVGATWTPAIIGGQWYNLACGGSCGDDCSCNGGDVLPLPGPVVEITSISVDGATVLPSGYRVDNHHLLVNLAGRWPDCQDMDKPLTETGTWGVTYKHGTPIPYGGQVAAGLLACEFAKAACGDNSCQLPQRVQNITRQGVSMTLLDSFEDIERGRTGIWLIDAWLMSVQHADDHRVYVASPDRKHSSVRSTTWP